MPFSQSSQLSILVESIEKANPVSIQDVSTGMGLYDFLARNDRNIRILHDRPDKP